MAAKVPSPSMLSSAREYGSVDGGIILRTIAAVSISLGFRILNGT
jgi:hypothetical protein